MHSLWFLVEIDRPVGTGDCPPSVMRLSDRLFECSFLEEADFVCRHSEKGSEIRLPYHLPLHWYHTSVRYFH